VEKETSIESLEMTARKSFDICFETLSSVETIAVGSNLWTSVKVEALTTGGLLRMI